MPASVVDQAGRIVKLHNLLASDRAECGGGVQTALLLEDMGCERKALYRCAEDLRKLGAPVRYDRQRHLWSYDETWNFPWQVVHTVSGPLGLRLAMDFLLDPELESGLSGLALVDPELPHRGVATLPRLTGKVPREVLARLSTALREHRRVSFDYRKPGVRIPTWRMVDPLSIFEWDGMPYLQARDSADGEQSFKRFALSRIERLEVLEARFRPPSRKQVPSCLGAFCREVFEAVIAADAARAPYVRERQWHPRQKNREKPGGVVEFILPFGDFGEATRWILGRGPGFRPVSPPTLVESWTTALRELQAPPSSHGLSQRRG